MPGKLRPGRLVADAVDSAVGNTSLRARKGIRSLARQVTHGGRFTCSCSPGKEFRGHREFNAHHASRHAGRWASASARKAARSMGKDVDNARRHALGWLESAKLREWHKVPLRDKDGNVRTRKDGKPMTREVPALTDRARTRPELRGRVRARDLRGAQKHDSGHQRADHADSHATRHAGLADSHATRAEEHADQGHRLRGSVSQARAGLHQGVAGIRGQRAEVHRTRADARATR